MPSSSFSLLPWGLLGPWMVLGLITALIGGYAIGFCRGWLRGQDVGEQGKTIRRLQDALMSSLEREARSRQDAEDRLLLIHRYEDELEEDDALRRTTEDWKRGMDPRIANASPEKIQAIYDGIFAPVRHSPVTLSYDATSDRIAVDLLLSRGLQ